MGIATDIDALQHLLGTDRERPVMARRYRDVRATSHARAAGDEWHWSAQPADETALAVVLVATVALALGRGSAIQEVPPGTLVFLHPQRATRIVATASGTVMCAWVPWDSLHEVESRADAPAELIAPSALAHGFEAFLSSLLTQSSESTPTTDYLVERLLAEMACGVLLEAAPRAAGQDASGIRRAFSLAGLPTPWALRTREVALGA